MKHIPTLSFAAALFAAMTLSAKADLVVNGGFEAGYVTDQSYGNDLPLDWTATQSIDSPGWLSVADLGDSDRDYGVNAAEGSYYLSFAASGPSFDTVAQTLTTTAGAAYVLSFAVDTDLNPDSGFELTANWNGTSLLDLTAPTQTGGWTQFSYTVQGTGSDALSFSGWDTDGYLLLDDVSVDAVAVPPVASPDAASVLSYIAAAAAIAGLALTGRRARKTV